MDTHKNRHTVSHYNTPFPYQRQSNKDRMNRQTERQTGMATVFTVLAYNAALYKLPETENVWPIYIYTHPFNGPFSGTTRVSRYQKGKITTWILLKQETVSGSGISWAICMSAPSSRQITTPAPHHSVFYRPDALPATQPTASKH